MRDSIITSGFTFYSGIDDTSRLTSEGKIYWFTRRITKILFEPLYEVRIIGTDNQKIWNLNLGVVTIICSAIEALSTFYLPDSKYSDKEKFMLFVEKYLDPIYQNNSLKSQKYSEILYGSFRCGLSHGFTIEGHEVATRPQKYIEDKNGYISIDLWTLFDDMVKGFTRYINEVKSDKILFERFILRFNKLFVAPYK